MEAWGGGGHRPNGPRDAGGDPPAPAGSPSPERRPRSLVQVGGLLQGTWGWEGL